MDVKALINVLATPIEFFWDWLRLMRWSKASPLCPEQKQLHYDILLLAHTVEKGLSVANTRPGFGKEKISRLLELLSNYDEKWDIFAVEKSYGCLSQYLNWHKSIGYDLDELEKQILIFINRCNVLGLTPKGGTKKIDNASNNDNPAFQNALILQILTNSGCFFFLIFCSCICSFPPLYSI